MTHIATMREAIIAEGILTVTVVEDSDVDLEAGLFGRCHPANNRAVDPTGTFRWIVFTDTAYQVGTTTVPRRKPAYLFIVVLLAIIFSSPQVYLTIQRTLGYVLQGIQPILPLPGVGPTRYFANLQQLHFWRDKLVYLNAATDNNNRTTGWKIGLIDPESGDVDLLEPTLPGSRWYQTFIFGNRIWFVAKGETWELIDNVLQKSDCPMPAQYPWDRHQILWEGRPAFVTRISNVPTMQTLQNNNWKSIGNLKSLDVNREYRFNGTPVQLTKESEIQVCNSPEGVDLFVHDDGLLFHRKGLEVIPLPTSQDFSETKSGDTGNESERSNLKTDVADGELAGWTLVREQRAAKVMGNPSTHGLLIDGQPVAFIVDDVQSGNAIGLLYRLEGDNWIEFASKSFPFGSTFFATVTTLDSQRTYVGVKTPLGQSFFYAIEATGFRDTKGSALLKTYGTIQTTSNYALWSLSQLAAFPILALILGIFLGICVGATMRVFTKPEYDFGVQSVKLASLGWRGLSRLIDLGLLSLTTVGLGWLMTLGFDWHSFAEALNMKVSHPTVPVAERVVVLLATWILAIVVAMLITQAVWGMTPGKWICRLRTVRTSLRPCGFARSLAREIVFFVDCCNFLCWTPGIVSIAFTDKRQRLGDLVADTIVVESRSMAPIVA